MELSISNLLSSNQMPHIQDEPGAPGVSEICFPNSSTSLKENIKIQPNAARILPEEQAELRIGNIVVQ